MPHNPFHHNPPNPAHAIAIPIPQVGALGLGGSQRSPEEVSEATTPAEAPRVPVPILTPRHPQTHSIMSSWLSLKGRGARKEEGEEEQKQSAPAGPPQPALDPDEVRE